MILLNNCKIPFFVVCCWCLLSTIFLLQTSSATKIEAEDLETDHQALSQQQQQQQETVTDSYPAVVVAHIKCRVPLIRSGLILSAGTGAAISGRARVTAGTAVLVQCKQNLIPAGGSSHSTCQEDGTWSPRLARRCLSSIDVCSFPSITNSVIKIRLTAGTEFQPLKTSMVPILPSAEIEIGCEYGFKLSTKTVRPTMDSVCRPGAGWTPQLPECEAVPRGCGPMPPVKHGYIVGVYDWGDVEGSPSSGRIICDEGYRFDGAPKISCQAESMTWTEPSGFCMRIMPPRMVKKLQKVYLETPTITTEQTPVALVPIVVKNPATSINHQIIVVKPPEAVLRLEPSPDDVIAAVESEDVTLLEAIVRSLPRRRLLVEGMWLDRSGDVNATGDSPLHVAARCNNLDAASFLANELPELVWLHNRANLTAIHVAALHNAVNVLGFLADIVGILEQRDGAYNRTALYIAAETGNLPAVRLLVKKGADVYARSSKEYSNGASVIHAAVKNGRYQTVRFLLAKYPDLLNVHDNVGRAPIHYAVEGRQVVIVRYLMELYPEVTFAKDRNGQTPIQLAESAIANNATNNTKIDEIINILIQGRY